MHRPVWAPTMHRHDYNAIDQDCKVGLIRCSVLRVILIVPKRHAICRVLTKLDLLRNGDRRRVTTIEAELHTCGIIVTVRAQDNCVCAVRVVVGRLPRVQSGYKVRVVHWHGCRTVD